MIGSPLSCVKCCFSAAACAAAAENIPGVLYSCWLLPPYDVAVELAPVVVLVTGDADVFSGFSCPDDVNVPPALGGL